MTLDQSQGTDEPAQLVSNKAAKLGFDAIGICDLQPIERQALNDWLDRGYSGRMSYMSRQAAKRREPATIVPGAIRAIVLLTSYYVPSTRPKAGARVARYAWGDDYHNVINERLDSLVAYLCDLGSTPEMTRGYADAGPVPERELATRAGLGWIAKNTMLINPTVGSYTFIATVFTDLELECSPPFAADHCGSCTRCLDACPTNAFPEARVLDAQQCISYLNIEYRGDFDAQQEQSIDDWLFGCDVCQEVCPWNEKFALPTREARFAPQPHLAAPDIESLTTIDDATFAKNYTHTAFARSKAKGIQRNARAVLKHNRD